MTPRRSAALLLLPAALLALASCASRPPASENPAAALRDVEGKPLPIGRGRVAVVVSYSLPSGPGFRAPRLPSGSGRPLPGRTLADPQAALVQLLDVGDRLPSMFARRLEKQLRARLKNERQTLAREITSAGFPNARREAARSLTYAVDMNGDLPRRLGLRYGPDGVATALFDPAGRLLLARPGAVPQSELITLLGRARDGRLAPPPQAAPSPGPAAAPVVLLRQRETAAPQPAPAPAKPAPAATPAPATPPEPKPTPSPLPQPVVVLPDSTPSATPRKPAPDSVPSKIRGNDRALLASLVNTGRPREFAGRRAVFEPLDPPKSPARPGPLEDAAIESEVRGRFAASPGLAGRGLTVRSRGGAVEISGPLDDIGIAAAAINAALSTPGVVEVSAEIH